MSNDSWKTSWANAQKKKEEADTQEPSWKASWEKAKQSVGKELSRESPEERLSRIISNLPGITPKMEETYQQFQRLKLEQEYQEAARIAAIKQQEAAEKKAQEEYNNEVSEWAKDNGLGFLGNGVGYQLGKTAMGVSGAVMSLSEALVSVLGNVQTGAEHVKSWVTGEEKPTDFAEQIRLIEDMADDFDNWKGLTYDEIAQYIKDETGKDVSRLALAAYDINAKKQGANEFVDTMYSAQNDGEIGTVARVAGNIGYGIGNMAPSIALAVASGGTSTAGEAAGAIPTLVDALKNGASIGSAAAAAGKALFTFSASTAVMSAQSAGDKYVTSAREYGTGEFPGATLMNAIGTGAIEGVTENLGGITGFTKLGDMLNKEMTGSILANVARNLPNLLVNAGEEGMEEIIASPLEGLLDKAFLDNGKPIVGWGNGAAIDGKEMLESGLYGSAIGFIMGSAMSTQAVIEGSVDVHEQINIVNKYIDNVNEAVRQAYGDSDLLLERLPNSSTTSDAMSKFMQATELLADTDVAKAFAKVPLGAEGFTVLSDGTNRILGDDGYIYDSISDYYTGTPSADQSRATAHPGDKTKAEIDADAYQRIAQENGNSNTKVSGADMATGRAEDVQIPSDEALREAHDNSADATAGAGANVTPEAVPEQVQNPQPIRTTGKGGLTRGADIETVSEQARKYAETGASIQETMDELVRSGLVADVNDLTQSEGAAISAAWYQGSLDYKAKQKQKKKAGEGGVRGKGERAETTGQSVSGKKTKKPTAKASASDGQGKKPTAKASASDGSGKKSTTQAKGGATTKTTGKAEGTTKPVKREGTAKGETTARTDNKPKNGSAASGVKSLSEAERAIYDRIMTDKSFKNIQLEEPPQGISKDQQKHIASNLFTSFATGYGENLGRVEWVGTPAEKALGNAAQYYLRETSTGDWISVSADIYKTFLDSSFNSLTADQTEESLERIGKVVLSSDPVIVSKALSRLGATVKSADKATVRKTTAEVSDKKAKADGSDTAKRKLQPSSSVDVGYLGKISKSIYNRLISDGLSFDDVQLGQPPTGFSKRDQETIVRALLNADEDAGKAAKVELLGDKSIHYSSNASNVAARLQRLGVTLKSRRGQQSSTSDVGSIRGETETVAKSDGKQYSLTDTATPRRQYKAKRTPTANSEATVSESKADKPRSEAAKPKSAEAAVETGAEVKTEAGDGNKAISMQDVIDKMQEDFGTQITRGYMRDVPKQAFGRYNTVDKGIRYRTANDVNTVSHELGHALDDRYHILTKDTDLAVLKWFANTLSADSIGTYRAAYGLSGKGVGFYLPLAKEGLADRLADYLTDAESALKQYPKFKKYFLDPIREKKGGKADLARLERYAEMVHEAVTNDEARLRGTVHTIEKPKRTDSLVEGIRRSFREGTPEERKEYRISSRKHKVDSFITTFFSKNQYIKTLGQQSNSGSCETYIDIQNASYNTGLVNSAMRGKITDLDGKPIGEGFHVILEGLTDKNGHLDPDLYHEFGLYLDIVHSAERQEQGHKIPQTMEKALEDGTIERMEEAHPDFPELADKVYEYSDHLLDVAVQGGLVEPEVVEKWREIYPHYVPMQRYFDQQTRESKGGARATNPRGFANVNSPYKRAKGSQLDYYNPLDLIIQQTATVYQSAVHNRIMRSIVDLVNDSPNPAILMERIPDDLHIDKISTKDLVSRLTGKVKNDAEIAPEVADGMLQLLSEAMPEYLSKVNTGTHTDASRRIVTVMENGKKVMYKVNDPDLFKVIVNMNPTRDSAFVRLVSTVSRGVVKMWTSLNPLFSFGNAARDLGTLTSSMATEFGGEIAAGKNDRHISLKNRAALMAQLYKNIGKSWAETAKERAKGLESTDPYHQEYIAMGGNESGLANDARYMSVDVRKEFSKENARKYGKLSKLKQGYAVLSYTTNMVERGPREAVYITAREMGLEPKLAYRLSQDVTTDFKNGGTLKGVSTFIPLFNAGLAGIYRAGRHWTGEHITSDYNIDPMTSKTRRKRAMGRILASVILSAAMAALQTLIGSADEEKYKQLSNYTKNNFMCIPTGGGKFITIPKPREWAALQSVFERAAEEVFLGNEYALDGSDTWEYLTDMFLPNGISSLMQGDLMGALGTIAGVGPLFEVAANKDYLGRDIVPVSLQDMSPKYQYNENTSWLAWAIGQILPISPLKIDHIGRNWAGGWWELMKGLTPNGLFRNGDTSNVSFALFDRWHRDAAYSTDIINRMYEYRDKANVAHNDNEDDIDAKIDYTWYDRMASFYSAYNKLAKVQPDSAQKRATRQTVLDMIEGSLEVKDGKVYSAQAELEDYVRRTGDTLAMPATMATEFKYGKNNSKVMTLDADQYVEFQLSYNTYYWNYIQQLFSSAYADKLSDASLKKSLHSARDRALTKAKQDIINKATKEK